MKEIKNILAAFQKAQAEGKRCALATVVHVEGSSYRRPGARMLVTDDGQLTGAISGGCLEGDALQKALYAINQQQNKLVVYDTTDDDDLQFGVQLGCNGIVYILFEPIDPAQAVHPLRLLEELVARRRNAVLATLFALDKNQEQPGTSLLFTDGITHTTLPDGWLALVRADVQASYDDKLSAFKEYRPGGQIVNGFIEFAPPPPSLVIAGAGNDVLPLVEMMSMLGWQITVVDGRPQYATTGRFGKADKVLVAKPAQVLQQLTTDAQTLFVLMTHNYNYDLALLRELLPRGYPYIGLLGPRKKLDKMLGELEGEGMRLTDGQLASIHTPIGLDIGAETAEEIAVSIVAEIRAFLSGRSGEPLKNIRQSIHNRPSLETKHG
jgi:xanthine dehydrogenase accessory factor